MTSFYFFIERSFFYSSYDKVEKLKTIRNRRNDKLCIVAIYTAFTKIS